MAGWEASGEQLPKFGAWGWDVSLAVVSGGERFHRADIKEMFAVLRQTLPCLRCANAHGSCSEVVTPMAQPLPETCVLGPGQSVLEASLEPGWWECGWERESPELSEWSLTPLEPWLGNEAAAMQPAAWEPSWESHSSG